jgi:hypothetical protein
MLHVIESRKAIDGVAKDLEGHAKRYASSELRGVAEEVERTLVAIMEEAAR